MPTKPVSKKKFGTALTLKNFVFQFTAPAVKNNVDNAVPVIPKEPSKLLPCKLETLRNFDIIVAWPHCQELRFTDVGFTLSVSNIGAWKRFREASPQARLWCIALLPAGSLRIGQFIAADEQERVEDPLQSTANRIFEIEGQKLPHWMRCSVVLNDSE